MPNMSDITEVERQQTIAAKEAIRKIADSKLSQLYSAYNRNRTPESRDALVSCMIQNRGYDGPTERFVASEQLFKRDDALYNQFIQAHTADTQKLNREQDIREGKISSVSLEGKGIIGDQSPEKGGAAIG